MNPATPLLSAEDLALSRGERQLFAGVGFVLMPGDLLLLRGPNGAGKSSLLLLLAGVLRATAGRIDNPGGDALHLLGHAPGIKARLTLGENLAFWRAVNGATGLDPAAALARVGLDGLGGIEAGHLSAGQTRRLALARLLVTRRRIWLLDEPLAALDASGDALVADLIARQRQEGGAVIAATHHDIAGASRALRLGAA